MTVAALFVVEGGVYSRPGVDLWGASRDARTYPGPHPVVTHPPCERWGRYWSGGPSAAVRRIKGDDGGCFASALHSVRLWGGVLEHPAASSAWDWHGLIRPHPQGWCRADAHGWTCRVEQIWYGHRARKATWLYAVRCDLPSLRWGQGEEHLAGSDPFDIKKGVLQRMSKRERTATPEPFADMLLEMAMSVNTPTGE